MARLNGLHQTHDWVRQRNAAEELLADPDAFLARHLVRVADYTCPREVHDALERGKRLGMALSQQCAASEAAALALADTVREMRRTVAQHFGEDFVAETIPFGILFKERATEANAMITGTGSCTFCKDNDSPDVD